MSNEAWKRPIKLILSLMFIARQRLLGFGPPGDPGLDSEAKALFLELLGKSKSYLEFGSGGTTLAAANARVPTVSVEADRFFARAVRSALPQAAQVVLIDVDLGITKEWSTPFFTRRTAERMRRWRRYIDAPFEKLGDLRSFPDFVLVDGRFRRACALKVASEAERRRAPVNILVDDYFTPGREHYHQIEQWLGQPRRAGRAALFSLAPSSTEIPSSVINDVIADYR